MSDEIRRSMPLFPMGIVQSLTDLTARQIRYYEQHKLINPARSEGNRRIYSLMMSTGCLKSRTSSTKGLTWRDQESSQA